MTPVPAGETERVDPASSARPGRLRRGPDAALIQRANKLQKDTLELARQEFTPRDWPPTPGGRHPGASPACADCVGQPQGALDLGLGTQDDEARSLLP
jgi:hypothetical protein